MHAENAYLFRHALLRDAAYQLQLPGERARLHALALEIMELLFAGSSLDALKPYAAELAEHARLASLESAAVSRAAAKGTRMLVAGLPARELHYLRLAARHAESLFRHDAAVEFHDRVAAHALANVDSAQQAALAAAECCFRAGRFALALERFRKVVESSAEPPGSAVVWLGTLMIECGQADGALVVLQGALKGALARGDGQTECAARYQLATVQHRRRDFLTAEREYDAVLRQARSLGLEKLEAQVLGNLAGIHRERDNHAAAERCYLAALELHRRHGAGRDEAKSLVNLAGLNFELGRFDQADRLGIQALATAERVGDRYVWAVALSQIAFRRHMRGDVEAALIELQRAESAAEEIGARSGILEHIAPLRVMMLAHRAAPMAAIPNAEQREHAAATLTKLRSDFEKVSIAAAGMPGDPLLRQQASIDELDAAIAENRPVLLWNGHPPAFLNLALRRALLEHLRQEDPAGFSSVAAANAPLVAAMQAEKLALPPPSM